METQLKLADLLRQSDEERKNEDVSFEVKQTELQLNSDILATERSLAEAKKNRRDTILETPFSAEAVIKVDIEIESLTDGLKRLNALKTELF